MGELKVGDKVVYRWYFDRVGTVERIKKGFVTIIYVKWSDGHIADYYDYDLQLVK